ncbi:MAG: VOC family protein [Actinobacteria bacterium]|nr:VOC family protein [Actinomycetota bacterium]
MQVVFSVSDLTRAVRFYERAFGWPRNESIEYANYVEFLPPDGGAVGLYDREGFAETVGAYPVEVPEGHVTPTYLYVRVEDVAATTGRIQDAGGRPLSPLSPRLWGEKAAWFADPDENVVAVAQATSVEPSELGSAALYRSDRRRTVAPLRVGGRVFAARRSGWRPPTRLLTRCHQLVLSLSGPRRGTAARERRAVSPKRVARRGARAARQPRTPAKRRSCAATRRTLRRPQRSSLPQPLGLVSLPTRPPGAELWRTPRSTRWAVAAGGQAARTRRLRSALRPAGSRSFRRRGRPARSPQAGRTRAARR